MKRERSSRQTDLQSPSDETPPRLGIVHVVSSLRVGGMEHFVLRIAAAQQRQGHRVAVLTLKDGPLRAEAQSLGLRVSVVGSSHKLLRVARAAFILARLRPDIVHAHNQTSLHYAVLGKRVSGARVLMTNHGQGMGSERTPSAHEWSRTDAIAAVSQAVADRMDGALADKICTIYNGVDAAAPGRERDVVRAELGVADRVVGIIVARIDGRKGHDTLLQALGMLQSDSPGLPVTVLIAGDGDERGSMEALARERAPGSDLVRFLGFRSDVADLLNAADFFVLPSLTEGLPLSVLEAMAHRLPTVATAVGGVPELITSGEHGLLVPVQNPRALADAIAGLITDAELRRKLGAAAYRRVRDEFSFEQMTCRYDALYNQLITLRRTDVQ